MLNFINFFWRICPMANTILTPTQVTREALRVLHQKLNFIGNINRQYDSSFAQEGAKIGSTLKIRLPNEYVVRTGATLDTQDTVETSETLTVSTQKGVDTTFTSADLTLSLQDFSERILKPAMAVLAASMEADALSMVNSIYNTIDNTGTSITFAKTMQARKLLVDSLAPPDGKWKALLNTTDSADLVNALKGLFQDSTAIKEQYREGTMGRTASFDFYENTLIPTLTSGTTSATNNYAINTTVVVSSVTPTSSLDILANTAPQGSFVVGDVFTITGLNRCHPETKADTGVVQQFVVTTAVTGASATSISFSPAIYMSGGRQNVVSTAITTQLVVKIGSPAAVLKPSLFYHPDAFTFASADLILPKGTDFAAREVQDGISMRVVRDYVITSDTMPCRFDVIYGYKVIRAQLAAKLLSN
jgi:hypothetical protein